MSEQNSLCFPCLEKVRTKFPVFPVPWPTSLSVSVTIQHERHDKKLAGSRYVSEDPEIKSLPINKQTLLELFACFLKKNTNISLIYPTRNVATQFISIFDSFMANNFNSPRCNFSLTVDMLHPSPSCLENGGCTILLRHFFWNSDTGRSSLLNSN